LGSGRLFLDDLFYADSRHILLAFTGGVVFNLANLLLVAAIDIAGLAVAFPVGIGLALVIGAVGNYVITPQGNPWMLFGGIALVLAAIVFDAMAYRLREKDRPAASKRGVALSLGAGLLMGMFYPFVAQSMAGLHAPGPYAVSLFFAVGVIACALPTNYLLMRKPLDGSAPVPISGFVHAPFRWHLWGLLGGAIWCTGTVLNFVASQAHVVGPAVSYSIGQGATMISAFWGVFIWHEFATAPASSKKLLFWMFLLFLAGLGSIALAPIF
jgi:glucose uptake protein